MTVKNVAPSIVISGAASVNEGSTYSLTLGAITDPGTDTVTSWRVDWGDGHTDTMAPVGSRRSHAYGPNTTASPATCSTRTPTRATTSTGPIQSVHVTNVAPTSSNLVGDTTVLESGSCHTLHL